MLPLRSSYGHDVHSHLHKSRLCVVPYTGLDLLEPLAGGDVIKWVKTEQVV